MLTVICIALCSVATVVGLVARMHKKAFSIIRGHNAIFDVLFTLSLAAFMAASGSLTGLMISAVTGVILTVTMVSSSWLFGGNKVTNPSFRFLKPSTWFKFETEAYPPRFDLMFYVRLAVLKAKGAFGNMTNTTEQAYA